MMPSRPNGEYPPEPHLFVDAHVTFAPFESSQLRLAFILIQVRKKKLGFTTLKLNF